MDEAKGEDHAMDIDYVTPEEDMIKEQKLDLDLDFL